MPAPKGPRPITVALNIVKQMDLAVWDGPEKRELRFTSAPSYRRLLAILTTLNAASGTTDERTAKRRRRTIAKRKASR